MLKDGLWEVMQRLSKESLRAGMKALVEAFRYAPSGYFERLHEDPGGRGRDWSVTSARQSVHSSKASPQTPSGPSVALSSASDFRTALCRPTPIGALPPLEKHPISRPLEGQPKAMFTHTPAG